MKPTKEALFHFVHGKYRFEVFKEAAPDELCYIGYCDGTRSISATRPDTAIRGLMRKHIIGLPEGKLIDLFAAATALGK